jgi:uncharacterized protein (DUF885 family)
MQWQMAYSLNAMPTPFEISDRFTEQFADHRPLAATSFGITGRDGLCEDFSPDAESDRADLYKSTRHELEGHLDHDEPIQRNAAKLLVAWLDSRIADHEAGDWKRDVNHIVSPFQQMRDVFNVMPRDGRDQWDNIISRLQGFGGMLDGYRECLEIGVSEGQTVASRQAESVLSQLEAAAGDDSSFLTFPEDAAAVGADPERVSAAVTTARTACSRFADWMREVYLPACDPRDAVGEDRYLRKADEYLGTTIDLEDTYEWGWGEVGRLRSEMEATAEEIQSGSTVEEVIELLDTDPARSAATRDDFVAFVSGVQEQAIAQLDGAHFDVPDELKTVSVNIAPPGGSLGAWYVGPSEDFSRSGSIWYAPGERERLPYWQEVATAYHEGFPGHHLQVGTAVIEADKMSRFHRLVIWYSGAGEGWALYAERLMDELGFFEKPEYRLGLLASQLFRATRVVVDIGCQLEYRIPDDAPLHAGDRWDYERAVDYMSLIGLKPRDMAESEVKRYLGWWGQAISYKVGEREILKIRDDVRAREGDGFDLKDFHRRMLEAGAIRLDHLREAMS